jgi:tRNA uridine 5-carboxymethylaminomethyl modification enzyme
MHIGENKIPGGRYGEQPALGLTADLAKLGFRVGRLKTGTCPRLDKNTIDFTVMEEQAGDDPPPLFSFDDPPPLLPQVSCYITHTGERTSEIIRKNLSRAPLFSGQIQGIGPRYCPSIEDKIVRFADKPRHQLFIEPEGLDTDWVYPNGLSTSLPAEVQEEMVHSIKGLSEARIIRHGYAVEYDFADPTQLHPTLETKLVAGLFHAGQINGTSGYEEAAGQGFIAGINAVLQLRGEAAFILRRDQAYIGVMIDDLTTRGVDEPYRLFTSRAEYRLLLREDDADLRLRPLAARLGLVEPERIVTALRQREEIEALIRRLKNARISPTAEAREKCRAIGTPPLTNQQSLAELLRRSEVNLAALSLFDPALKELKPRLLEQAQLFIKYEGYLARQEEAAVKMRELDALRIPRDFSYLSLPGLSREMQEKLSRIKPASLGQAGRIPGVTPAAVQIIWVLIKKHGAA